MNVSGLIAAIPMNDLDMDLERAIQMRRGIGQDQDQYVDGLEAPLGLGQPQWKADVDRVMPERRQSFEATHPVSLLFYPVVMTLVALVVFVFIKLRGFLLFRRLLSLFVSR